MTYKLITAPTVSTIDLAAAKAHLRVTHDLADADIEAKLLAATAHTEARLKMALLRSTWALLLDYWPNVIQIERKPVASFVSLKYYEPNDTERTVDPVTYQADLDTYPARILPRVGQSWPASTLRYANGIVATFTCGYASLADVPAHIRLAIHHLLATWFANRETIIVGTAIQAAQVPHSYEDIIQGIPGSILV